VGASVGAGGTGVGVGCAQALTSSKSTMSTLNTAKYDFFMVSSSSF